MHKDLLHLAMQSRSGKTAPSPHIKIVKTSSTQPPHRVRVRHRNLSIAEPRQHANLAHCHAESPPFVYYTALVEDCGRSASMLTTKCGRRGVPSLEQRVQLPDLPGAEASCYEVSRPRWSLSGDCSIRSFPGLRVPKSTTQMCTLEPHYRPSRV
ncbi:hypothetical protein BD626DRAFT_259355 [Schizophyllum amplum]|uniref:Uncharacterized protein n=1 Tax=Schizophyllum amplum TaxID=97359 RepID=A0A550BUE9_9AGAR|nr:hypothetical protein BD626DRAFT_259355 [Auriculariopsis ampla]